MSSQTPSERRSGADRVFTAPQEPSIASFTSSDVTATTADLIATINPNGSATTYRFEYGTSPSYGQSVPIPDGPVGSGETPIQVKQHIEDLEVGATYHFRVVAENQWGEDVSGDQTFAFFTANCPNAHVRQESGAAYLPDCRAYELVSPEVAGAVQLFPGQGLGPIVNEFIPHPLSSNTGLGEQPVPLRILGRNRPDQRDQPAEHHPGPVRLDPDELDGWKTHYPGLSASTSFASGGTHCSASMALCENYDVEPIRSASTLRHRLQRARTSSTPTRTASASAASRR